MREREREREREMAENRSGRGGNGIRDANKFVREL